jgi:hypothetical protein
MPRRVAPVASTTRASNLVARYPRQMGTSINLLICAASGCGADLGVEAAAGGLLPRFFHPVDVFWAHLAHRCSSLVEDQAVLL